MTFPLAPLPVVSQFFIDGAWVDAKRQGSSDFRYEEGIDIIAGRKNEQGRVTATTVDATLNNRDGKWSDLNPLSPYYGKLPQNTLMRHYIPGNSFAETYGGTFPNYGVIWSTDHADYDITGDIDIRVDCQFREWRNQGLAAKYITTGNQSWAMWIDELERIRFVTSSDGSNIVGNVASQALNLPNGARKALRVTFDVDDGAGNRVATFYTADTIDGPWVQFGGSVSVAGTTSIFAGDADLEVGAVRWLGPHPSNGRFFAFEMYNGIAGTLAAHFDFRNVLLSGSPYLDSTTGKFWRPGNYNIQDPDFAIYNPSRVVPASVRCCVEVAQWPQEWDSTGTDIYTPIQGAGILRRLTQGKKPVWSPFRRSILRQSDINSQLNILAYWPCEDKVGSRTVAAATPGTEPMQVDSPTQDAVVFEASANDENGFETNFVLQGFGADVLPGTMPLPNLAGGGRFIGKIPQGTSDPIEWGVQFVQRTNGLQAGEDIVIARWETPGGTQKIWEVVHTSTGEIEVATYTSIGSARTVQLSTVNSQVILSQIRVDCRESDINPGNLSASLWVGGNFEDSQEIASSIMARPTEIQINPDSNSVSGVTGFYFGHLQIWDITSFYFMGYSQKGQVTQVEDEEGVPYYPFYRYLNERAADRLTRVCEESGIDIEIIGDRRTTPRMGPQPDAELMDILYECEDIDGGVLYEANDKIGFVYVCRSAMLNYVSSLDLDYSAGHLSGTFRPNPDDLIVRNDIEVKSTTGSSARSTLITGKLSIQEPPDGVGVYDESKPVNVAIDADLPEIADMRRHVGTWDEPRYPSVEIGLHRAPFVASAGLRHDVYGMGVARFLSVSNVLSPPMAPDIIRLLAQGYRETLRTFTHTFRFNCVPAGPYLFARAGNIDLDNAVNRVAADGDMVLSLPVDQSTSRYTWDVDDEGWVGEGSTTVQRVTSTVHDGAGALEATNTLGAGFGSVRFNDANQLPNDISAQGDTLRVWCLIPNNTPGEAWQARIEVQDSSFTWQPGPNHSMHPGIWQLLEFQTPPGLLANKRGIGIEAGATDVNATVTVLIDTMDQYNQDTQLYVHSVSGDARWATLTDDDESPDDFPMDAMVGGERVTVTDVNDSLTDTFDIDDGSTWPGWNVLDSGATLLVASGTARQTQTVAGDLCILTRDARSINQRIRTLTTIDNGSITGATATTWLIARALDASNYYVLQAVWGTDDSIKFAAAKRSAGSLTALPGHAGTQRGIFFGFGAGLEVMLDFMVLGINPTRIYAKAWVPSQQNEPTNWQLYTTDDDDNLETGTLAGLGSRRETGNTNANLQFQFRDFRVLTPQSLTVTRGVNGIRKPHAAGSELEVIDAGYVGR